MEKGLFDTGPARILTGMAFLVWAGSLIKLAIPNYHLYKLPLPITIYVAFLIWTVMPTILNSNEPLGGLVFNIMWLLMPLLTLVVSYNTAHNSGNNKWFVVSFIAMGVLISYQYFLIFRQLNIFSENNHLATSYHSLYMLPLMLLVQKKWLRIVIVVIVTLIIITSIKRAGIIAIVLGLFAYLSTAMFIANRINITTIIVGLLLIGGFGFLFFTISSSEEFNIIERFENIGDDGGSGRDMVWEITAKMISKKEPLYLIVGDGYNSVVDHSPIMLSAHNDFLEVTYDYGIIGILLYAASLITLFFYILKMIRYKSPYAPPLAMLFIIYLILSTISHVIIYYWANIVMMSIGYFIGNFRRDASDK